MKLEDTIKGFQEIIDGKHDDLPEQAFYMVGTIEEAVEKGGGEEREEVEEEARRPPRTRPPASPELARAMADGAHASASRSSRLTAGVRGRGGDAHRARRGRRDRRARAHAPLIAMLKAGSTRIHLRLGGEVLEFATGPGFFKVEQDRALALVDDAVTASEIDDARAQEQLEEAQAELEEVEAGDSDADRWQLEQRIRHAENQLASPGAVSCAGRGSGAVRSLHGERGFPMPSLS